MALLTWSEKYSVGIRSVDDQHLVLFNAINDLHDAMMKGQARKIVGDLLNTLIEYTREHFSCEEKMMESAKYAGLASHMIVHRTLTKQVEEFVARHEKGDLTIGTHLAGFLSDWLTRHILEEDKTYSPWMKEHGAN